MACPLWQVELAEARRLEAEAQLVAQREALTRQATDLEAARAQNEQLLRDLELLLSQRGSLDALRGTLTQLLPPELAPALAPALGPPPTVV